MIATVNFYYKLLLIWLFLSVNSIKKFRKIAYDMYLYDTIMAFNRGKNYSLSYWEFDALSLLEREDNFALVERGLNHRDKFSMFNKRLIAT